MNKKINIIKKVFLVLSLIIYAYLVFYRHNRFIYHMNYLKCTIFIVLISIVVFILGLIENESKSYRENINIYIILYLTLLVSVTFFIGRTDFKIYKWWFPGQYVPFKTIKMQFKYASMHTLLKNVFGNLTMLTPLSFLLMIKNKKFNNIFWQSIIILPIILLIEVTQALTHIGSFDIDDIILNYVGTIIFTFLITRFHLIDHIRKLFYSNLKKEQGVYHE